MSLLVLILIAWLAGRRIVRVRGDAPSLETFLFALYAGFAAVAVVVACVGAVSLSAARFVLLIMAAAGLAFEFWGYSRGAGDHAAQSGAPFAPRLCVLEWISLSAIMIAAALSFAAACAPATGWDATVAHLALPADYAREGRILLEEGNEYSAYPHLAHCLYAIVFFSNGETAVQLLSWLSALMACGAAYALGRRVAGRETGIIAAAILATAPIFYDQASNASIDMAFCGFALMALTAFAAWREDGARNYLLLAGLLAGSACGIRHTGYFISLLLVGAAIWTARESRGLSTGIFICALAAGALPWMIRSAALVGNPFYPFFDGFFQAGVMPHRNVTAFAAHESIQGTSLKDFLLFPWDIVMRPQKFDGWAKSPGGLVLFLGIPGLFIGGRHARALGVFSGIGIAAFFFFQRLARYILPFFAPMMVVAAIAVSRTRALRPVAATALVISLIFGICLDLAAFHVKIPVLAGFETREEYLSRRVERYTAFKWASDHLPINDTVFTFDRRAYYLKCPTYQNDEPLKSLRSLDVAQQVEWFLANGIRWVFLPVTCMEESPGYRNDFLEMISKWRSSPRQFRLYNALDVPRARGEGTERVEIYEVRRNR